MPPGPLQLTGLVTKVGFMNKTATVTVSRWATHAKTMKVSLNCSLVDCVKLLMGVLHSETDNSAFK